jgi:hypothetical protein
MTNEVRELLDALYEGRMGLDEVAARFRQRTWPWRHSRQPSTYLEMAADELLDPDPYLPGSFDDVIAAYDAGKISTDQFRFLSHAVAQAPRADHPAR